MEAIVAVYTDWGIGSDGTQPIVVPEDRRRFAEITRGATLIVGSKTLLDFPGSAPLKGRRNIIMTRHENEVDGAEIVHTPEEAAGALRRGAHLRRGRRDGIYGHVPLPRQDIRHQDSRDAAFGRLFPEPRLPAGLGAHRERALHLRRSELRVLRLRKEVNT